MMIDCTTTTMVRLALPLVLFWSTWQGTLAFFGQSSHRYLQSTDLYQTVTPIFSGETPEQAKTLPHRSIITDYTVYDAQGNPTSLNFGKKRLAVAVFLRSLG